RPETNRIAAILSFLLHEKIIPEQSFRQSSGDPRQYNNKIEKTTSRGTPFENDTPIIHPKYAFVKCFFEKNGN
ncbi:MAG: hypothetical protein IIV79_04310, partial [Clostridia bacterium]|nr:hypothetical protein [Clostridia bacterium]